MAEGGNPTAGQVAGAIAAAARVLGENPLDVFDLTRPIRRSRYPAFAALFEVFPEVSTGALARMTGVPLPALQHLVQAKKSVWWREYGTEAFLAAMTALRTQGVERAPRASAPVADPARVKCSGVGGPRGRFDGPMPALDPVPAQPAYGGSRTAGKPVENPFRPNLLDDASLRAKVYELRGRATPWPHIAKMTGKPTISLRRAFDPTFEEG